MELLLSLVSALLVGSGVYLMLQRTLIRVLLGLLIISNAVNLIIFTAGGLKSREAPIIAEDQTALTGFEVDPLPQALILTAIVIGFALIAFLMVLAREYYRAKNNHLLDRMRETE